MLKLQLDLEKLTLLTASSFGRFTLSLTCINSLVTNTAVGNYIMLISKSVVLRDRNLYF